MSLIWYRARATWVNPKTGTSGTYTESGEGSLSSDTEGWAPGQIEDYIWREGNYSCDCNRGMFFEPDAEVEDDENCGDVYRILKLEALSEDGSVVYTWPEPYEREDK